MDDWALPTIAAIVLVYAATSRGLSRAAITPAIFFTAAGLIAGSWLGLIEPGSEGIKLLAEATLTLVLFADASRISVKTLRGELAVPVRLLSIGLPLTIVAGTLAGFGVLPGLTFVEALVLSTMLACTDAALGQAVVTDERVPSRIRQGLNVESGLNDGLCVPLFLIALAVAEAEDEAVTGRQALHIVVEEIGYGVVGGTVAGLIGIAALRFGLRRAGLEKEWTQILTVATAVLAAGVSSALGGSMFIGAFVAGFVFGVLRRRSRRRSLAAAGGGRRASQRRHLRRVRRRDPRAGARRAELALRRLRGHQPHGGSDDPGCDRTGGNPGAAADRRLRGVVRPARPGIDRLRRHAHRRGVASR